MKLNKLGTMEDLSSMIYKLVIGAAIIAIVVYLILGGYKDILKLLKLFGI